MTFGLSEWRHYKFNTLIDLLFLCISSYIYEIAGGRYRNGKDFIYAILNWRHKPGRAVMLVIPGIILSPFVHTVMCWGVHFIRLKLFSLFQKPKQ